jgi:hypothetical protein
VEITDGDDQLDFVIVDDVGKSAAAEVWLNVGDGQRTDRSPRIITNLPRPAAAQPQLFVA